MATLPMQTRLTWLVTKEDCLSRAAAAFADINVKVTSEGRPYLEAALGTKEYIQKFVSDRVQQWAEELDQLATIAHTQPHVAHAEMIHGMTSKRTYLMGVPGLVVADLPSLTQFKRISRSHAWTL